MKPPVETIPEHLREYITEQDPGLYTPIDHAVWRYVMGVSRAFFAKHGHPLYLEGLKATGISTDRVPLISEMDQALRKIGWRAVAINGFIPPAIFLEFQSLRILAIACDIRKLENIGYTPSPDIIHEAAGHVPIVADPAYRKYLEAYGEVARNAIITRSDLELYDAIFGLSQVKEDPKSTPDQIERAQKRFEETAKREVKVSEAALLTRMAWWTTEYGLVEGESNDPSDSRPDPLIYGAGLLSSIAESYHCLSDQVKKIPFTLQACISTSYDITRPQPQLFVAKNFEDLIRALEEFASTMAFKRGGGYGLRIGIEAENTVTAVLDTGVQLTGILKDALFTSKGDEAGFVLSGVKQISYHDQASEIIHNAELPEEIFIPLFEPSIAGEPLENLIALIEGPGLEAKTGLLLKGLVKNEVILGPGARFLLIENPRVTDKGGRTVFTLTHPLCPIPIASRILSVFGGAADRKNFVLDNRKPVKMVESHQSNMMPENRTLNGLYREVREFRDSASKDCAPLHSVLQRLDESYPLDWLLRLEVLELCTRRDPANPLISKLKTKLEQLKAHSLDFQEMIQRGMEIL